ncbi:MAG: tRNA (guanosine(46)-N7)-methyltransferase TrmB [Fibrobacterota bacterium]
MRLRNVKNAGKILRENPRAVIMDPEKVFPDAAGVFAAQQQPLHIEIGSGKGAFIIEAARRNPHINFIGIERFDSILIRCLEKLQERELKNLVFMKLDARYMQNVFARDQVSRIYLNFSDPWPKKRHAKRRLTHSDFLPTYKKILCPGGEVSVKTDNRLLFEFTLKSLNNYGFMVSAISLDLHAHEPENNIRTEYEKKWSRRGSRIYSLSGSFRK